MRLEEEVTTLRARVEHLEAIVHHLTEHLHASVSPVSAVPLHQTQLRAWLAANGAISQPSALEQAAAQRWFDRPEEEKQRVRAELDRLPASPMISDIVADERGGA